MTVVSAKRMHALLPVVLLMLPFVASNHYTMGPAGPQRAARSLSLPVADLEG
jgi:hypothetical protein